MGLVDQIRRWRLVQQGLSSGKKRRTSQNGGFLGGLDRSLLIRGLLYLGFALGMVGLFFGLSGASAGRVAETVVILVSALAIFQLNHREAANRNGSVLLVFGGILVHLYVVKLTYAFALQAGLGENFGFLLMPMALAPMVHSVLLGQRAGEDRHQREGLPESSANRFEVEIFAVNPKIRDVRRGR